MPDQSLDYERGYQDGVRDALESAEATHRRRVTAYIDRVTGTRCADTSRPQDDNERSAT